jgi:Fur family ferric uptake transcriptional regulator
MAQVVKLDEHKHLPALGRQFLDRLFQARDLLFRPDDGFNRGRGICLVDRAFRIVERHGLAVLSPTMVVDDEIRGDAKEKGTRIGEDLAGPVLQQANKRILDQVLGGFRAAQAASQELLQVVAVISDQRRHFQVGTCFHSVWFRRRTGLCDRDSRRLDSSGGQTQKGMFDFQVHLDGAEYQGVVEAPAYVLLNKDWTSEGGRQVNRATAAVRKSALPDTVSGKRVLATQETLDRVRASLGRSRLRWSPQREQIVMAFLKQDHITIRSLYGVLNRNGRRAPLNTIYRTMRVLCDNGFAQTRRFGEETQYDNISAKGDHDHLICTGCGHIVEFEDPAIEGLRQQVASANGFHLTGRNLELYGLCAGCRSQPASPAMA